MADKRVGKITHYYNKIAVAVVALEGTIKIGDTVRIEGHDKEFTQKVASMQIEHEKIIQAQKGDDIGLKVNEPVKENDIVYKVK